ncbi:hypothetical protein K458DRAFT_348412 [Lentithecium fluviatile CBS 122367]|uniref:Serine/threonine-protein kinase MEC1 n=1 Tax=Lentithecium fluviatile CBS 122367 TaxID=1168545 RepID=A0A6G1IJG0_9PLEO|nr:hypothetical protein K458DRAFT_348412 [Lentithecium fluviatile CBS 122367]
MARRGGSSTQRQAPQPVPNGNFNGLPPPSTIPAQIVHNAANINNVPQNSAEKPPFIDQVKDFLRNPELDDPDPVCIAFVCTIAKGGIDPFFEQDPFNSRPLELEDLVIHSIEALKVIFEHKPYLLLKPVHADTKDGSSRPPILIWLFPKLVGLLARDESLNVDEHVQNLLITFLDVLPRSIITSPQTEVVMQFYRSCVESIILALEPTEEVIEAAPPAVHVQLPPASSITVFWPDVQNCVVVPQDLQRDITSLIKATYIGFRLNQALLQTCLARSREPPRLGSREHLRPWALDACTTLWRSFKTWSLAADTSPINDEIQAMYMEQLETVAFPNADVQDDFSNSHKAALSITSGLLDLLPSGSASPLSESHQIRLAMLLARLRSVLEELPQPDRSEDRRRWRLRDLIMDSMEPSVASYCWDIAAFTSLHRDLQLALCLWTPPGNWPAEVEELRAALCSDGSDAFWNDELNQTSCFFVRGFRRMNLVDEERPAKRRRTLPESPEEAHPSTYSQLVMVLNGGSPESPMLQLSNLHHIIEAKYSDMPEDPQECESEQCELLSAFCKIACAGSQCLQPTSSNEHDWQGSTCIVCDAPKPQNENVLIHWDKDTSDEMWKDAVAALITITQQERFDKSSRPRVLMAVAIRRVFTHLSEPDYFDLEISPLGRWLINAMTRSLRELRIAASHALMTFLGNGVDAAIRDKNRRGIIQLFVELTKRNVTSLQETLILAYGQAARLCREVELEIILGQLVEYLGHTNTVIYGAAFNELLSLADEFKTTTLEMLRPYWRTIGFKVVNEISNKPQKAQLLGSLLEISVPVLLREVQGHVLPILVLNKRKDVIERIAKARATTVEDVCLQPYLAHISALLLCQTGDDVEQRAMDSLIAVAPGFRRAEKSLRDVIIQELTGAACEVLKMAAEQDEGDKKAFHDGFIRIAKLDDDGKEKEGKRKPAEKSEEKQLETFILKHILGIVAHISGVVENSSGTHPLVERKRSVGAVKELIHLAGQDSRYALPQLRACLQSAMADAHLCDQAFISWSDLLWVLDTKNLKLMIDQTFALIVQNWSSFADDTRAAACKTLDTLRLNHNRLLQDRICFLPSLASIPMLSKLEGEIARLKAKEDPVTHLGIFSKRCNDENAVVVRRALLELVPFLETNQGLIHESAISPKPLPALTALSRSLLDICSRFPDNHGDIPGLCAQCLGLIGGLDPYRVETVREKKRILVLSNFLQATEVLKFAAFMLEEVIIKVFQTTSNTKAQGFLAYLMQELCKFSGFTELAFPTQRTPPPEPVKEVWEGMDGTVRTALAPFLNSRYAIKGDPKAPTVQYPIFGRGLSHATWLRKFTHDLLLRAKEHNARQIFDCIAKVLRHQDHTIDTFIIPYAVVNAVIDGDDEIFKNIGWEMLSILEADMQAADHVEATNIKQCSENVFQILDYLVLWLQEKRKAASEARLLAGKTGRGISESEEMETMQQISAVEGLLQFIPAKVISQRAVECGSYARALFHWEQYYREEQSKAEAKGGSFAKDDLLQHLQFIYAQIDEPDSIEGISAHLQILNPEQQIMEHRKAGRWTAAQSWYELALAEKPNDPETQVDLLTCLKESGQYDAILNYVDGFHNYESVSQTIMPFAAEAAWSTGKWDQLERTLTLPSQQLTDTSLDFNVGIGKAMLALRHGDQNDFKQIIGNLRGAVAKSLSPTATASLHAAHEHIVKLHTLYELEAISGLSTYTLSNREVILENLDRRLDILGAYVSDKQYLLGVRRAAMKLSGIGFTNLDIASAWLTTSRLARKGDFTPAAFNSILHASQLGGDASKIEYSKMLWKQGHHRKAIQNLRGAITSSSFAARDLGPMDVSVSVSTTNTTDLLNPPNKVKSHALLLLAKWLDRAGQTQSSLLKEEYARGIMAYPKWDKGHYYLGRYYLKLYESEKALPVAKQASNFVAGELTKLVIENYIRSTVYGSKYYYQTIPKILTLWLDMGTEVLNTQPRLPKDKELHQHKLNHLDHISKYIKRYANERMPAYPWYTAFPQIITRISHANKSVWEVLQLIIIKVAGQYPQQALWSLLAVLHSTQDERRTRGSTILKKLTRKDSKRKAIGAELRQLIIHGQQLTDSLLMACDAPIEQRISHVSLSRDLGFRAKLAPCALVVPIEASMIPTLPSGNDSRMIRAHNPFPQDAIAIHAFEDDVFVLSSLQRPRKITVVGSDGRKYGLLCKPKDDLRKDQRLMEFNAMINRALQRDIEASKRRLYIKTYGVTPLNEECGTIEWVEGLKPMRDIIIRLYRQKSINIDYGEIRILLNEASSDPAKIPIFTDKILKKFLPVLHEWFVESFPEPEAWFAARLRYTRSCAVMSIVGHVLGLGDRHGENVLLEEGNGGTFHVDFNCLFDKGLTFEKPELVPFRLTHNMVDAMGPSGVEGPFRKTAELTYKLLRQHEDTLITILETFVHDPTADFLGGKRKKKIPGVAETPQEVLEIVRGKLGGFVRGESVPLSVEGYVDSLVRGARDPRNLAAMYIGWCAFF